MRNYECVHFGGHCDVITNIDPNTLKSRLNSVAAIPLRSTFGVMKFKGNKIYEDFILR